MRSPVGQAQDRIEKDPERESRFERFVIEKALNRLRNIDADNKEIIRGSAVAFGVKILASGSTFAMNLVIARQLGAEEAGLFFLASAVVLIAAAVSRLGLDNTFVRFIAAHQAVREWGRIKGLYLTGVRWSLIASLLVGALLWLFSDFIAVDVFGKPAFAHVMSVMALAVPFIALFTLHAKALQGNKRILQAMIVLSVATPLALLALAFLIWPQSSAETGGLFLIATGLAFALGLYWWLRVTEVTFAKAVPVDRAVILASCLPLLSVVILNQTVTWSSQIMLGAWASSADVAIFNAAQHTAMLTSFVLVAVNSIAAPKFAAMYRAEQRDALQRMAGNASRLMALLALAPLMVMLILPHLILSLFGPQFPVGATALRILAIGQFINVATGSVGFLLSMTGHEKLLRNNVLIAAAVALTLGFALIPAYGISGAAVATATGVALQNLLCVWQVRRVLGFNTLAIWK